MSERTSIPQVDAARSDSALELRATSGDADGKRLHVLRRLLAVLGWAVLLLTALLGLSGAVVPWVGYLRVIELPGPSAAALQRLHLSPTDMALISAAATTLLLAAFTAVLATQVGRALVRSRNDARVAQASMAAVRHQSEILQRQLHTSDEQLALTREALATSQEQCNHIVRLELFPQLVPDMQIDKGKPRLRVVNSWRTSAIDVDVWLIGVYTEDDEALAHFIAHYARPENQSELLIQWLPGEKGQYGVFDCLTYPVFPAYRQVEVPLSLPRTPRYVYVHLQFRDIAGRNYLYSYGFVRRNGDGYRLGGKDPMEVVESARLDPYQGGGEWIQSYFAATELPRSSSRRTLEWIGNIARSRALFSGSAEDEDALSVWSEV